jgi:16S rRNA processing protein RimM
MTQPYLEAGKVVGVHGVRGAVRIEPWANDAGFLCGFKTLYIDGNAMKVRSASVHKNAVLVCFEGIDDMDGAVRLKNKTVCIDRKDADLESGEHFIADLVGLKAVDAETGEALGTISEILPLSPHSIYVIKGTREILVPAVPEFVRKIDIEAGCVLFRLIEGL